MWFNLLSFQGDTQEIKTAPGEEAEGAPGSEGGGLAQEPSQEEAGPTSSSSTAGSRGGPGRIDLAEELLGVITHGFRDLTLQEEAPLPSPIPAPLASPISISSEEEMVTDEFCVYDLDNNIVLPSLPATDGFDGNLNDLDQLFYDTPEAI